MSKERRSYMTVSPDKYMDPSEPESCEYVKLGDRVMRARILARIRTGRCYQPMSFTYTRRGDITLYSLSEAFVKAIAGPLNRCKERQDGC